MRLEDQTSPAMLASPGGPLHVGLVTHCDGCRAPLAERYHALDEQLFCQRCAVLSATETLIDGDPGRRLDAVELQALDILRAFVREVGERGT